MQSDVQARMRQYIRKQSPKISGWLAPESAEVICHLALTQIDSGFKGGIGEIGIHHGKLFILLYLSLQEGERALALDVFEDQELNLDNSGLGDRAKFLRNFAKVGGKESDISIFANDSCAVSADVLRSATGPLRLMSIDGGHTEDVTYNDMGLADELLLEDGVLILDDAFNERWPAVASGAYRFLLKPTCRLRPFAISPNKTYFCKSPETASIYRAALADSFQEIRQGEATVLGSEVLILAKRTLVNRVRNIPIVRENPVLYRRLSDLRQHLR